MGNDITSTSELIKLRLAVKKYHAAVIETNSCVELLRSDGCDPKAAEIMQNMYQAQHELFKLVGIDYHGGH